MLRNVGKWVQIYLYFVNDTALSVAQGWQESNALYLTFMAIATYTLPLIHSVYSYWKGIKLRERWSETEGNLTLMICTFFSQSNSQTVHWYLFDLHTCLAASESNQWSRRAQRGDIFPLIAVILKKDVALCCCHGLWYPATCCFHTVQWTVRPDDLHK